MSPGGRVPPPPAVAGEIERIERQLDDTVGTRQLIERFEAMHRALACGCAARVAEAILADGERR